MGGAGVAEAVGRNSFLGDPGQFEVVLEPIADQGGGDTYPLFTQEEGVIITGNLFKEVGTGLLDPFLKVAFRDRT